MELFGLISIPRTVLIVCFKVSRSQSHSRQDPSREPEQGYGGLSCNNPHSWSNQRSGLASHDRVQPWASMIVSGEMSRLVFDESLSPATDPLGCEPKIPRTYKCRPTSKNAGLFAFHDYFLGVFRGFRLSNFPRIGTALCQVPMIRRQSCLILAPNSRRSRSLSGIRVIRRLRSGVEWETNTEIPFFQCF